MEVDLDKVGPAAPSFDMDKEFSPRTAATVAPPPPIPPAPPQEFVREIDLGDGSGVQRFIGKTPEELIDKLAEAQRNATYKIQELSRQQYAPPPMPEIPPPQALSPEEQFLIGQQFQTDPVGAFDALFQMRTGMSYEDFQGMASYMAESATGTVVKSEIDSFLADHEYHPKMNPNGDYLPNENNRRAVLNFLEAEQRPLDRANLEYAFMKLNSRGLLEKPQNETKTMPTTISDRGSVTAPPPVAGSDVAQWLKTAPLDEVKKYYNQVGRQFGR